MTSETANRWLDAALGLLYPNACQICGTERATAGQGYVCTGCRSVPGAIRWVEPPFCERCGLPFPGEITSEFECGNCREMELHFDLARASVAATPLVLKCIHLYKYNKSLWIEPFLAELFINRAGPALRSGGWDQLVPVPLFPVREREREFNQATRLAVRLSKATGLPLNDHLIQRVKPTGTQTMLTQTQRTANVRGAFALFEDAQVRNGRFVLVDDVLTTGATTSECARVLKKAGAASVSVWTLARAI